MVEIVLNILIFIFAGVMTGLVAGVLGIGGGMVIVPALLYIFQHTQTVPSGCEMHFAAGTSLAIMIFTAQASVRAHLKHNGIRWDAYFRLQKGIIVGAILGAIMAEQLPTYWLRMILGVFLLLIATEMMFNLSFAERKNFPAPWVTHLVSTVIGFKSGLLGIGGGALIIPYLTYCGVTRRETAGISAMCSLTISLIGTVAFMITGSSQGNLPAFSTGYVYWPAVLWIAIPSMIFAPIGARLTYRLSVTHLKYAFLVVLIIAAINLLR
jgi:uncharacterized membrane protein YfcA